mmetsp:Transcript_33753/g.103574  ORF Transcript_33753/g.103574 Transcript_33753/m.103574 type:complete len:84 (+) Transcript_33753:228-479(+)
MEEDDSPSRGVDDPNGVDREVERRVNTLALCACLNSVALGYQIGAVAVANALLKDNLHLSNRAPSRGRPGAAGPRRRVFAQAS